MECTIDELSQMVTRCREAECKYHKSEETLATLRMAVDTTLVSTHMLPLTALWPHVCSCFDNNVMTKAEYMRVAMIIVKNTMVKIMITRIKQAQPTAMCVRHKSAPSKQVLPYSACLEQDCLHKPGFVDTMCLSNVHNVESKGHMKDLSVCFHLGAPSYCQSVKGKRLMNLLHTARPHAVNVLWKTKHDWYNVLTAQRCCRTAEARCLMTFLTPCSRQDLTWKGRTSS